MREVKERDFLPRDPVDGQTNAGERTTEGEEKRVGSDHPSANKTHSTWRSCGAEQDDSISLGETI